MHSASTDANVGKDPIHAYTGYDVLGINCSKFGIFCIQTSLTDECKCPSSRNHIIFSQKDSWEVKRSPRRQARSILGDGDKIEATFDKFIIGIADGERWCRGRQDEKQAANRKARVAELKHLRQQQQRAVYSLEEQQNGWWEKPPPTPACPFLPCTSSTSSAGCSFVLRGRVWAGVRFTWTHWNAISFHLPGGKKQALQGNVAFFFVRLLGEGWDQSALLS